jgi:5-(carboxyamino)imidazole ribonucleotide synthase
MRSNTMTTIGILGGGQLGRMLALAGYPLGFRFRFLDPVAGAAPVDALAERVRGDFTDDAALERFVTGVDVVTYEFENVPVVAARRLAARVPVYPPPQALEAAQDRLVEKAFFRDHAIPTPPFLPVTTRADLDAALAQIGLPAVLKTRRMGYDGKGQALLRAAEDVEPAWAALQGNELILEGFVAFDREVSILAARSVTGETAYYPLVQNRHREGILRRSVAPAPATTPELQALAQSYAARVLDALAYAGVLAIELFQVGETLIANEMAPRVHNSGHWTIEGAETSQFAQHLRAITGLPLGSTAARGHAAMLNLIGTLPDPAAVLAVPGAHLHLYDKAPRPSRKLGHITLRADDPALFAERLATLRALLR